MNGLVYSLDDDGDNTPVYWMGIALAALLVHGLMFFGLPFNGNPPPSVEEPVTVTLDDSLLNMLENATATTTLKPELQPAKTELVAQQPKIVPAPPVPSDAPASIVEPPPLIPEKPKAPMPPPAVKPVAKEDAKDATSEKKPLNDKDLPSLKDHAESAFDVDANTSKLAPREAYLSDRNSTAADRGPKNLPQGDPYIDKGDTNLIKYLGKRGEGNKPAVASDANSGSIKKEGSEESGDGGGKQAKDLSKTTRTAELLTPLPKDTPLKAEPADKTVQPAKIAALEKIEEPVAPQPAVAVRPDIRVPVKSKLEEPDLVVAEHGTIAPPKRVKEIVPEAVQVPTEFAIDPPRVKPAPRVARVDPVAARPTPPDPSVLQPTEIDKAIDAQAELDRFEAQLNGVNSTAAAFGRPGTGAKLRKGQKGHEGNGTARPGDDAAVSDVTSINLESSASELGDPRFAKKFDAKTAYIRNFARRIDGKWKADIQAHLRVRLVPGTVSIRIVIRKDGMLMDASEAYRDRGVPDEYVATARRAVKEAANPTTDPFPPELESRETIEYTFNFLYQ